MKHILTPNDIDNARILIPDEIDIKYMPDTPPFIVNRGSSLEYSESRFWINMRGNLVNNMCYAFSDAPFPGSFGYEINCDGMEVWRILGVRPLLTFHIYNNTVAFGDVISLADREWTAIYRPSPSPTNAYYLVTVACNDIIACLPYIAKKEPRSTSRDYRSSTVNNFLTAWAIERCLI